MIISRFNKYVEKHGRVTYIVLGIIICFMFVIFVGHGNDTIGGCSGVNRNTKIAKIFGKTIDTNEFMLYKRMTDIRGYFRYGMFLSEYNDTFLNRETISHIRMVLKAKKDGFYKQVTDEEIAKAIQNLPFLKDKDGKFSIENFTNFKNGFLRSYALTARDFDELMRQDLAISKMTEKATADVKVDESEIDSELAEYTLKFAEINLDIENAAQVSDAEYKEFFEKRKSDIPLEKLRTAEVAWFSLDEGRKLAAAADAPAELKVTDEEIAKNYENGKNGVYKGQKLEQVKSRIKAQLTTSKVRAYTRNKANGILTAIKEAAAKGMSAEEFTKLAQEKGATVKTTGDLGQGAEIPGIDGKHPQLANAIRALDKAGAITERVIVDGNNYYFAMLSAIKDAPLPKELTDDLKAKIKKIVIEDKAEAYYNATIAPYASAAATSKSAWDIGSKSIETIRNDVTRSDEDKEKEIAQISDFIREEITPFYQQEQRSARVAAFTYADYEKDVVLTEGEIQAGFEARKAEYDKISVRLAKILIKASTEDTDEQKNASKAKADEVYKKLTDGEDFAKLVAEYSEDEATKGKGGETDLVELDKLDPAIREQISHMELNQLSPVIGTADGHLIFKLLEKTAPKTLEDVRAQLVKVLTEEAAKKAAMKDAELLEAAIVADWDSQSHAAEKRFDIFKAHADGTRAMVTELPMSRQFSYGAKGAAGDRAIMGELFRTTLDMPYTKATQGTEAAYVACLNEEKAPYLQTAKEALSSAVRVYKRHVASEVATKKATESASAINAALKSDPDLSKAAGELAFKDASGVFTKANARQFSDFHLKSPEAFVKALEKTQEKSVAEPQKTYNGLVLAYLDSKVIPSGDEAKADRDSTKERLLNQKKSTVLRKFMEDVEKESKTNLYIPSLVDKDAR